MQRCILIGAGDCSVQKIETKPEDLVIAVDGGYDTCRKYDIVPDLIMGDFDSVQESDMPQIAKIAKFRRIMSLYFRQKRTIRICWLPSVSVF